MRRSGSLDEGGELLIVWGEGLEKWEIGNQSQWSLSS